MHRENRLPQGREHGAVTPRATQESRNGYSRCEAATARMHACLHGGSPWRLSLSGRREIHQTARGALRSLPGPLQSWSLLGPLAPSFVPGVPPII
jgi:hypothetical protein